MTGGNTNKRFLNEPTKIVQDAIMGFCAGRPDLAICEGMQDSNIKVVVRNDDLWKKKKEMGQVALISGGGAGHEPAHAGFVGEGKFSQISFRRFVSATVG